MSINEGSCRCCLLVGSFSDMWTKHDRLGEVEVYGDMIKECFGVSLYPLNSSNTRDQICEDCITSLRDARTFKKMVLNSDRQMTKHIMTRHKALSQFEQIEYLESDGSYSDNCDVENYDNDNSNITDDKSEAAYVEKTSKVEFVAKPNNESEEVSNEVPKIDDNNPPTTRYTEEKLKLCLESVKAGHLNQVQAADAFNIPRQTICFRLKQETGENYKEIVSGWKKTQLKVFKDEERKKGRFLENASKLYECLESVKKGSISMTEASMKYKISMRSIKKALREEYGPNYNDAILKIKKNYRRNAQKACAARKSVPTSKVTLIQAVNAVREKKMSVLSASGYYNIAYKLLLNIIMKDIDVSNADVDTVLREALNNYTESNQNVRNSGMSHKRASEGVMKCIKVDEESLKIKTVTEDVKIERELDIHEKSRDKVTEEECLSVLLHYTNAIPFKVAKGRFKCAYCQIITENTEELRLHTQIDHKHEKDYKMDKEDIIRIDILDLKCVVCDQYIEKWYELIPHFEEHNIKIVNSEKIIPYLLYRGVFICALCEEIYPNFEILDAHMSEHFVNYVCQDCGQRFFNIDRLRRHKRCNDKYICNACGKEFNMKYHLRVHMENHMKSKISCRYCKDTFDSAFERYVHIKKVHPENLHKYPCKLCKKIFSWKPFYVSHYRIMHVRNSRYQCNYCRKKFFTQISLEIHTKQHQISTLAL